MNYIRETKMSIKSLPHRKTGNGNIPESAMQTMWNQTNFVMLRLVAILILTISGPAAAGCEYSKIEIDSHNKFINAYNKEGKIKNFILGKIIRNLATSSDDIHFVDTKIVRSKIRTY